MNPNKDMQLEKYKLQGLTSNYNSSTSKVINDE